METNREQFLHMLVFRCAQCGDPISNPVLSEMRNLEAAHATSFHLRCACGWEGVLYGAEARLHWIAPWARKVP